jgi:hypothetical protein
VTTSSLIFGIQLALPSILHAEEMAAPAEAAASLPVSPVEILLLTCPLVAYGLFNKIRDTNPQVGFGEYALSLAFTVILANIISILAFQTRIY